jgi:hypothetical protein
MVDSTKAVEMVSPYRYRSPPGVFSMGIHVQLQIANGICAIGQKSIGNDGDGVPDDKVTC